MLCKDDPLLFQHADPIQDFLENCKDEVLAKAANGLDPEVGCGIPSIDYQSSYINILKAVGYLNKLEVTFLATNMKKDGHFGVSQQTFVPLCLVLEKKS